MNRIPLLLLACSFALPAGAQSSPVPGMPTRPITTPRAAGGDASTVLPPAPRTEVATDAGQREAAALQALVAERQAGLEVDIRPPPAEITVDPNRTEIIPIALGHMNRLVTVFTDPVIETTAPAGTVKRKGGVLYVATNLADKISMYVMERDQPERAISLLLVPRALPPVQVRLHLEGFTPVARPGSASAAEEWETSAPYLDTIKELFRTLALGEVPQGYGLEPSRADDPLWPDCWLPGIDVRAAQRLEGHNLVAFVGRAVNRTLEPIEIDEQGCAGRGVLAVAAWPGTRLEPGADTELYVAVRRPTAPAVLERPRVAAGY